MFFPEIDREATKKNARRKLREYARWRRLAGDFGVQKVTATFSFEPRQAHTMPSRAVERLAINRVTAEMELEAIERAVNALVEPVYRRVLVEKFLLVYPKADEVIYRRLGYERSRYYELVDEALLAFAEAYRHGALMVLVDV